MRSAIGFYRCLARLGRAHRVSYGNALLASGAISYLIGMITKPSQVRAWLCIMRAGVSQPA